MITQELDPKVKHRCSPKIHSPVDLGICPECEIKSGGPVFDVECKSCVSFLESNASLSEMFAILRQWMPSIQQHVWHIICKMLESDIHVDDRDGLTDMTMLHYAVKSGAKGIGSMKEASRVASLLLSNGADPYIRCRWTNMAAIHYAAFFDVSEVLEILLDATKDVDVDSPCSEFDQGTPLHISCKTLALESVKVLLKHGADASFKDSNGFIPIDVLPDPESFHDDPETANTIFAIKSLIVDSSLLSNITDTLPIEQMQISHLLKTMDLKMGDKVFVAGVKSGALRYCGPTLFANGLWAGIELDEAVGKNDGSIDNIQYFKCPSSHGIFAPLSKISKHITMHAVQENHKQQNRVNLTHVTAKVNSGLKQSKQDLSSLDLQPAQLDDRVMVSGKRAGVVRYIGETRFAPGIWYGIELDQPFGKNDGSVDGFEYFSCPASHGVFAPPSRILRIFKGQILKTDKTISRRNSKQYSSQTGLDRNAKLNQTSRTKVINSTKSSLTSPKTEPMLAEGTHVFCNGEIGVVLYMGPVSFAEGVWLGVELRTPKGRHDGAIHGQRYFTCKPGHGLLVRPSKVYVRGINGSKLIATN